MNQAAPIAIVLALQDDNYDFAAATMVRSAIDQMAEDDAMVVYLLADKVSPGCLERLARSWLDPRVSVHIISTGEELRPFDHHPMRGAIARLLVGALLPLEQKRVIHLDVDMLVLRDLRPLWETDLRGMVLGCVGDSCSGLLKVRHNLERRSRSIGRELRPEHIYFNAGLLLVDLERWRDEKVGETTLALLLDHPGVFPLIDQDVLNLVLQGRVHYLSPIWNAMDPVSYLWQMDISVHPGLSPEQAVLNPAIRHFAGNFKPWHLLVRHSEVERYGQAIDRTDWYGYRHTVGGPLRRLLQRWIDFHWLTVRTFWWPRGGELFRRWLQQTANPLWWAIYLLYFVRLVCLVAFYWPLRRWRERLRRGKNSRLA